MGPEHFPDSQGTKKLGFGVLHGAHSCQPRDDSGKELRIAVAVVESGPGSIRHRSIENKFDPVGAMQHFGHRRGTTVRRLNPGQTRGHVPQVLERDRFLSTVEVGNPSTV